MTESEYKKYLNYRKRQIRESIEVDDGEYFDYDDLDEIAYEIRDAISEEFGFYVDITNISLRNDILTVDVENEDEDIQVWTENKLDRKTNNIDEDIRYYVDLFAEDLIDKIHRL